MVSDIVGIFTDPILVFPGGWGDTLPDWIKGAITMDRLEMGIRASKGEDETGTDAEACAYVYTCFNALMTISFSHSGAKGLCKNRRVV